jgi:transposase
MDVVHRCCCGLDVHKDTVTACVAWAEPTGKKRHEKRQFGTATRALLALADWLRGCGVTHVAMESTGVYWQSSGTGCHVLHDGKGRLYQ